MPNRYFIKLSYNGKNYHGWQIQKNGNSVQETLSKALTLIIKEEISITGAGRTDTGVHARNYYAHFNTIQNIDLSTKDKLLYKLNNFLPEDIVIHDIIAVAPDIHARFSAISRTYKYYISTEKNPFTVDSSYYLFGSINVAKMNEAALLLFNYKDFTSFSKSGTQVNNNLCQIQFAQWEEHPGKLIFTIKANRFLRNMVRAITGTIIDIGKEKISIDDFRTIIESKNRSNAGYSVPAQGLFLEEIEYENLGI